MIDRQLLLDAAARGDTLARVAEQLGVSRAAVCGSAWRQGVRFPRKDNRHSMSPTHKARLRAGMAKIVRRSSAQSRLEGRALGRKMGMSRSMGDPNYVYKPRSAETKARMSAAQLRWRGIPEGYRKVGGALIPAAYYDTMRPAFYRVYSRLGRDAAFRFMAAVANSLSER